MFSAIPQNTSKIAENATFQWVFENNALCTNQAVENSNCTNQVVDHTFQTLGAQKVQLLISGLSPISFVVSTINAPIIPAVRREVRDHNAAQWDQYVSALYVLKDLQIIDHLAAIHAKSITTDVHGDRGAAHGGPSFLPWHRTLCRVMELNLQTAMNNSVFGIPYWAWDADKTGNNLKSSIVLTDQYYGTPAWAEYGNQLVDGPFCITNAATCTSPKTWTIPLSMEGPSLHRNYTSSRSTAVSTTAQIITLMKEQTVFDSAPFSPSDSKSFRAAVEGWMYNKYGEVHNGVHDWIGGTMGKVAWSMYDPLFFAHHTQMVNDHSRYISEARPNEFFRIVYGMNGSMLVIVWIIIMAAMLQLTMIRRWVLMFLEQYMRMVHGRYQVTIGVHRCIHGVLLQRILPQLL